MRRSELTYIYVMRCPTTDVVKYVGKTINPSYRFRKHLTEKHRNKKCLWVNSLLSRGLKPVFEIVETVPSFGDWETAERNWIRHFRDLGQAFCNQTDGGESGSQKGRPITKKHKTAISLANTGRKRPDNVLNNKLHKARPVGKYDLNGHLLDVFQGTHEAAKSIGRNQRRLHAMCKHGHMNGKTINHVGGFIWKYLDETND